MSRSRVLAVLFFAMSLAGYAGVVEARDGASEIALERTLEATPDDMATYAPNWVEEIRAMQADLARLDETTRKSTAGEGISCVVTSLESAQTLAKVSDEALATMQEALARGELERAGFEYRKIAIALKKTRELAAAAEECALGAGIRQGRTRNALLSAPNNPDSDMRALPNDIVDYAYDPVDASPF
jgi:hypothetical protein